MLNIKYEAIVTAEVINNDGVKKYETKNTLVNLGEDFITTLLSKSGPSALNIAYGTAQTDFIDIMALGAGYKLGDNSTLDTEIILPYDPVDGNESVDYFNGCTVYCIYGANQGTSKLVSDGGYTAATKKITLQSGFANVPLIGDVYVISTAKEDVQLNGEGTADGNSDTIINSRKFVTAKNIQVNTNELEILGEWVEADGDYVISEVGLFYNLSNTTGGDSSAHTPVGQKLFARASFQNNPVIKTASDKVNIKWRIIIGDSRD